MGCDPIYDNDKYKSWCFNPRTHMGCDGFRNSVPDGGFVSIHAPTWGATKGDSNVLAVFSFQSTHPHGVRLHQASLLYSASTFQSTHPHGVRHHVALILYLSTSFNPRTHMGCDLPNIECADWRTCFNPRTHMGCDPFHTRQHAADTVSIHAPTWGATRILKVVPSLHYVSIHAPTWGATCCPPQSRQPGARFNPRTHMGCDVCDA